MMFTPPLYCPDAIATDNGWVNPKNGELLVAIKNLSSRIRDQSQIDGKNPTMIIVDEIGKEVEPVVENVVESVIIDGPVNHVVTLDENVEIEEEIPAKKRPGRPKKIKQ